ncbi:TetR/AcrR family transcriptional regulator [Daejeonella lutea]|uniref:Transcriptional regulator, TetR family n=1 Tax=Daejeonella lutea TaxID=572036 RepID=A0A1T5EYI7_9SPHI|nr:TetR/AcrR family transcriptional regulator [Daejeonella lutea]SKB89034.1 transcriptional regulator, TetR family [Daejeonella lutea]
MADIIPKDEILIKEILEAARELFSRYGLKKTTMDDVARAVGKGKSSLYYYYTGKNELFEAVVLDELKKILKDIRIAINGEPSSTGKLKAFLVARLQLKDKMHNLGKVIHDDIFDNFKEICRLKGEFEATQVEIVREIVYGGVQSGEFREMPTDEIGFFSRWTVAAFGGLELPLSTSPRLIADKNSIDKIVDFILFGIGR